MTDNDNATGLAGMWCLIPDDGEYTLKGELRASIGSNHHLVKIHTPKNGVPPFSQLMTSDDLCADDVMFFDSETDLEMFVSWEPDGGGPRVVNLRTTKEQWYNNPNLVWAKRRHYWLARGKDGQEVHYNDEELTKVYIHDGFEFCRLLGGSDIRPPGEGWEVFDEEYYDNDGEEDDVEATTWRRRHVPMN